MASLGERFENHPNALTLIRLVLAGLVIVWHSVLLRTGRPPGPLWQGLEEVPVDGFFAISGFLIVRSWQVRPDPRRFLVARAARLLPGLWLCLIVTAFVIVPIASDIDVSLRQQLHYVAENATVLLQQPRIGDTPVANSVAWNVSLWSLWWELLCYLSVLALGRLGYLSARVVAGIGVAFWSILLVLTLVGAWALIPGVLWVSAIPRLGFMFALGGLLWIHRERVPFSGAVALTMAVVFLASLFTPNYHLLGAPALAYLLLWLAISLGRFKLLVWRQDFSYGLYLYGAVVEQSLIGFGLTASWWSLSGLAVSIALPLAMLSWFVVERPSPEPGPPLVEPATQMARELRRETTAPSKQTRPDRVALIRGHRRAALTLPP